MWMEVVDENLMFPLLLLAAVCVTEFLHSTSAIVHESAAAMQRCVMSHLDYVVVIVIALAYLLVAGKHAAKNHSPKESL